MVTLNEGLLKLYRRILYNMSEALQPFLNLQLRTGNPTQKNKPLMIVGPSCVGKKGIINKLKQKYPNLIYILPSYTTRPKMNNEIDGVDYYFITKEEFNKKKNENDLICIQEKDNNYYSLSKDKLREVANNSNNKIIIVNQNISNVDTIKDAFDFNYVAILSPSEGELRNRLIGKGIKNEDLDKKMEKCIKEIQMINGAIYINYRIVNFNEERTLNKIEAHLKEMYPHFF